MSERVSITILEAEYYNMKASIAKEEREMIKNPNQYSHNFIEHFRPVLLELEKDIQLIKQSFDNNHLNSKP